MSKRKTALDQEIDALDLEIQQLQRMRERLVVRRAAGKAPTAEGDQAFTPADRQIGK